MIPNHHEGRFALCRPANIERGIVDEDVSAGLKKPRRQGVRRCGATLNASAQEVELHFERSAHSHTLHGILKGATRRRIASASGGGYDNNHYYERSGERGYGSLGRAACWAWDGKHSESSKLRPMVGMNVAREFLRRDLYLQWKSAWPWASSKEWERADEKNRHNSRVGEDIVKGRTLVVLDSLEDGPGNLWFDADRRHIRAEGPSATYGGQAMRLFFTCAMLTSIAFPSSIAFAQTAFIEGHVFNKATGIPLSGAVVRVFENATARPIPIELGVGITDANGFYQVETDDFLGLPAGINVVCTTLRSEVEGRSFMRLRDGTIRRDVYLNGPKFLTRCRPPD